MKNSADLRGCYPFCPSLDLQNFSYPPQPHSRIAKYTIIIWKPCNPTCDFTYMQQGVQYIICDHIK